MKSNNSVFLNWKPHFYSIVVGIILYFILKYLGESESNNSILIGSLFSAYICVFLIAWAHKAQKKINSRNLEMANVFIDAQKKCETIARKYKAALATQRSQLVYQDPYGSEISDKWIKNGIQYFIKTQVLPNLTSDELTWFSCSSSKFEMIIDSVARKEQMALRANSNFNSTMSGIEYEEFCKGLLEKNKWIVKKTITTGDQGVDLVGSKNGIRVAIQCKRYTKPIGNKAVQEIYSGMKFYDVPIGIVVSNQTFTQSARILATKNNVFLIHHDLLASDELFQAIDIQSFN